MKLPNKKRWRLVSVEHITGTELHWSGDFEEEVDYTKAVYLNKRGRIKHVYLAENAVDVVLGHQKYPF